MKTPVDSGVKTRRARHPEGVILFFVSNQMFAIAAEAVQEIRSTDSLAGAAIEIEGSDLPKVRHTIERGRHIYYVVNGCLQSRKQQALKDYNQNATQIVKESDEQVSRPLFSELAAASGTSRQGTGPQSRHPPRETP